VSEAKKQVLREILAITGFLLYLGTFVMLFLEIGWWGFWAAVAMLTGSLLIFLVGLPKLLTDDLSQALPPDSRQRLGWDTPKDQS
jgi:hypothetical protein